ncbi:MAG: threonylcarbamoyl-AMP synthase [Betaproteobacteria bacterium]|nr:threonylcarbamoyl-AMP synthase [Betaproteobacteria bacterium]
MIVDANLFVHIQKAALELKQGRLIGFPTETVYGLGADACNAKAVEGIFLLKGRPSDHPLIVHIANKNDLSFFATNIPAFAQALMDAFWPGPLTLILTRQNDVATAAAGGQGNIGIRMPSHSVALAVLKEAAQLGVMGVAAPSANRFGRVSPTTALHVQDEFGQELFILDAGACPVGIESVIVDCTRKHPVLLRPGMLTIDALSKACGQQVLLAHELESASPKASGTLESHYAPQAKVILFESQDLKLALKDRLAKGLDGLTVGVWTRTNLLGDDGFSSNTSADAGVFFVPMPNDAAHCAQALFSTLRELDGQCVDQIWIERPPSSPDWTGVLDRLERAAY